MFGSFSPDLLVSPVQGKVFSPDSAKFKELDHFPEIHFKIKTLEEKALLKFNQSQYIVTLRGLDSDFSKTHSLDTVMIDGKMELENNGINYCVLGAGVQSKLSVNIHSIDPISVYAPEKNGSQAGLSAEDFNERKIYPSGVFSAGEDFDNHLVLVPLRFIRELLNEPKNLSSLQIYLQQGADPNDLKEKIKKALGPSYKVQDRFEQNEVLFKVLNSEKWAVYLMLTFILTIAVFNIMGSLTMLVIEKKKDISILSTMGAKNFSIQSIFLLEGMILSLLGTLAGLGLGLLFCLLQIRYGFISIGESHSFAISAYPVVLKFTDFLYVFLTVFSISLLATFLASRQSRQDSLTIKEQLTIH